MEWKPRVKTVDCRRLVEVGAEVKAGWKMQQRQDAMLFRCAVLMTNEPGGWIGSQVTVEKTLCLVVVLVIRTGNGNNNNRVLRCEGE